MHPTFGTLTGFDVHTGLAYADGDEELYREVLIMFLEQLTTEFAHLPNQLRDGSNETLSRKVHTLKGSASSVGAIHIETVVRDIEQHLKHDESTLSDSLINQLQASLKTAIDELSALKT
ncbi:Hpt domain-containing protein [Vreelandella aquamarina]